MSFSRGKFGRLLTVLLFSLLAGCQMVPGAGPSVSRIQAEAANSESPERYSRTSIFDLVSVDGETARVVTNFQSQVLNRRFGFGSGGGGAVIGVGDQLRVTIFEAGTDGLFSTTESKQTVLEIVVQPDGMAAIPYVGQVRFAGRTLEQARQSILSALEGQAVQPDVIITAVSTESRTVTVSGDVNSSGLIPLSLTGDQITEMIAKAGGPSAPPYESYVTLVRGEQVGRVLLKSIIENPRENVYVRPRDQVFVTRDPRTFTILGEAMANNRIEFGANDLNLLEAIALAGGETRTRVDAAGYFVFRYEEPDIVKELLGQERVTELLSKGMAPDRLGRYPIVYQIDMKRADSMFVGQNFPIVSRDVIYVARHPSIDLQNFLTILQGPLGLAAAVTAL